MMIKIIKHFVICTLLTGLSFNAIAEDLYEPNNTLEEAYISLYGGILAYGVANDEDWYQITVTSGNTHIQIDLAHSYADGDLDIQLVDASGYELYRSDSVDDNEVINYDVVSTGTYYIRVYNWADSYNTAGQSYALVWSSITATPTDDYYEENDDYLSAYDHTFNEGIWLSDPSLSGLGISNDYDYYKIQVTTGYTRVQVELQHTHLHGDLGIELFDASGNTLDVWSNSDSDNESIDYDVGTAGTYYILVYNNDAYTGQSYDLQWDDLTPIPDDSYEENDDYSTATSLPAGSTINAISKDNDFYQITVAPGSTDIEINLDWIGTADPDLDLGLYVYNPGTNDYDQLDTSFYGTNNENISIDVFNSGTYYIWVDTYDYFQSTSYTLSWSATTTAVVSGDDQYEENNTAGNAYLLSGLGGSLNGVSYDEDWYQIIVPVGERLQVDLLFSHGVGSDLDITLYEADGTTVIVGSYSVDNNEAIDFTSISNDTYYLLVETYTGSDNNYSGTPYGLQYAVVDPNKSDTTDTTTTSNTKTGLISSGGGGGGDGGSLGLIGLLLIPLVTLLRRKLRS